VPEQLETEFTFEPAVGTDLPDLDEIPDVVAVTKPRVFRLEAVYFDTEDFRLMRSGVTLRRRTGGEDAGWHLKVPTADDAGRTEVHAALGRASSQPPAALRTAALGWTRGASVVPVATIRTRRALRRLRDARRQLVAEVCVDTVQGIRSTGDGSETNWTEWELELGPGASDDAVQTLVDRLTESSGQPHTGSSKLRRTLGDAAQPGRQTPIEVGPDSAAAEVVHARIGEQVRVLLIHDSEVRRDVGDGVHKARVAMRRLRSALATFRPWLDRERTDRLRAELRWAGRILSEVRDAEVLQERLTEELALQSRDVVIGPVRRDIDRACRTTRRLERTRALEAMTSARYLRMLNRLDELVAGAWGWNVEGPGRKRLRKRTEREWRRVCERYEAAKSAADDAPPTAQALHAVRKAVKRLRYAGEAIEPVFGSPAAELAARAEEIQTVLGEHQDSVVARAVLRDLAREADGAGASAFTYGRLHGLEDMAAAEARAAFDAAWQQLEDLKPGSVLR
jgi:CHAD domain-containing protein